MHQADILQNFGIQNLLYLEPRGINHVIKSLVFLIIGLQLQSLVTCSLES